MQASPGYNPFSFVLEESITHWTASRPPAHAVKRVTPAIRRTGEKWLSTVRRPSLPPTGERKSLE
ncbi:hypothetical protein [Natronosalvus amylolyticus]|uniref:hypothetical protein n=1 Tax=Natronosalvus amylolyticus TaxID=2961994 RepID=UPI0020CA0EB8|nr:hypothetical protein [Natronosalvus amylolyticus]